MIARNDAIMNNIANVDTPGFTARTVEFESALQSAIDDWRSTGTLDLSRTRPRLSLQDQGFAFRIDGNNVDMEREMVALYINSIRADVMFNSIMANSRMLNTVLQGR
jgi:flagellar basal-body rod protein FlgB